MAGRIAKIGTRGSALALEQTRRVRELMPMPCEVVIVHTSGDRLQEKALQETEAIGFFTKEIEQALLHGEIDLAVHSLKDLPVALAPGLFLGAVLTRAPTSDVLLIRPEAVDPTQALPLKAGSQVGVSSVRRQTYIRTLRHDVHTKPIRGNVPTRLEKVQRGDYDATILARAGLMRLLVKPEGLRAFDLNPDIWISAPGQGAIAVEIREDDREMIEQVRTLNDDDAAACGHLERSLLKTFGGGCHAPFGAWVRCEDSRYTLKLAAPGTDGGMLISSFTAPALHELAQAALPYLKTGGLSAGMPLQQVLHERDVWIAQPAQPWC
jgi:hydroxymethylbilane synthase